MEKIVPPFTQEEYDMIKYSFKRVADKYSADASYPRKIAKGDLAVNTPLSKNILKTLKQILHVLKPLPTENV